MEKKEITIPGYEGLYYIYENGDVFSVRKQRFLKPAQTIPYGYVQYFLCGHDKKDNRWFKAHRLVAHHWLGPCPKGKETNHINDNKADNHYSNLEYVTHSQNVLKSFQAGRKPYWLNVPKPPPSLETRIKMSNAKLKPCIAISSQSGTTRHFDSITELCDSLNIYYKAFYRHVNSIKPYKGYIFRFTENKENLVA